MKDEKTYLDYTYEEGLETLREYQRRRYAAAQDDIVRAAFAEDHLTSEEVTVDVLAGLAAVAKKDGFDIREVLDEAILDTLNPESDEWDELEKRVAARIIAKRKREA